MSFAQRSDDLSSASAEVRFSLNKTTSFWTSKSTPFCMNQQTQQYYFLFLDSNLHFCSKTNQLSLSPSLPHVRPPLPPLSLPRRPEDSPEVSSFFSLLFICLFLVHFHGFGAELIFDFWEQFLMVFGTKFMGFDGESV